MSIKKKVAILLVGIGGYGNGYVKELLMHKDRDDFYIAGVVDIKPESCSYIEEIKKNNIPIFSSMQDFYDSYSADLAVISTPIQYHCEQTCYALEKGSNVLCEKPIAATVGDALKMDEKSKKTGKFIAIGYQWSYSEAFLALKRDILENKFGKPKSLKTIILRPRDIEYFNRGWAGKIKDNNGNWVLDSVANNSTAHYLHNMFHLIGDKIELSDKPKFLEAELYRANNIENFDTACVRAITNNNVEILFYATHAVNEDSKLGPDFYFEFENGIVTYTDTEQIGEKAEIKGFLKDGTTKVYGNPFQGTYNKLWRCINEISVGSSLPCGIQAAIAHTMCIDGMHKSMPDIVTFPEDIIKYDEATKVKWVKGLGELMAQCYKENALPNELGASWAKAGRRITIH